MRGHWYALCVLLLHYGEAFGCAKEASQVTERNIDEPEAHLFLRFFDHTQA